MHIIYLFLCSQFAISGSEVNEVVQTFWSPAVVRAEPPGPGLTHSALKADDTVRWNDCSVGLSIAMAHLKIDEKICSCICGVIFVAEWIITGLAHLIFCRPAHAMIYGSAIGFVSQSQRYAGVLKPRSTQSESTQILGYYGSKYIHSNLSNKA